MNASDPAPEPVIHSPINRRLEQLSALERSFAAMPESGDATENAARHISRQIEALRQESTFSSPQVMQLLREIAGQCTAAMDQLENRARELSQEPADGDDDAAATGARRQLLSRVEELRKEIYRQLRSLQQSEEQGVPGKLAMALGTLYRRNQPKFPPMSPN